MSDYSDLDALIEIEDGFTESLERVLKFTESDEEQHKKTQASIDSLKKTFEAENKKANDMAKVADTAKAAVEERAMVAKTAKAAHSTTLAVCNSIDKFKSGDTGQISMGVFDIMSSVSQFAAMTGPQGTVIASVFGPMFSMAGAILGTSLAGQGVRESPATMVYNVVEEVVREQHFNDLMDEAKGIMKTLTSKTNTIRTYVGKGMDKRQKDKANDPTYLLYGEVGFLEEMASEIRKGLKTKDGTVAEETVFLIYYYTNVAQLMQCHFLNLSLVYMQIDADKAKRKAGKVKHPAEDKPPNDVNGEDSSSVSDVWDVMEKMEGIKKDAKNLFGHTLHAPALEHFVFTKLHTVLDDRQRASIEALLGDKISPPSTLLPTQNTKWEDPIENANIAFVEPWKKMANNFVSIFKRKRKRKRNR